MCYFFRSISPVSRVSSFRSLTQIPQYLMWGLLFVELVLLEFLYLLLQVSFGHLCLKMSGKVHFLAALIFQASRAFQLSIPTVSLMMVACTLKIGLEEEQTWQVASSSISKLLLRDK